MKIRIKISDFISMILVNIINNFEMMIKLIRNAMNHIISKLLFSASVIFLSLTISLTTFAQWVQVGSAPIGNCDVNSIMVDKNNIFVGSNWNVLMSPDSGNNWLSIGNGVAVNEKAGFAFIDSTILVATWSSLFKSCDYGVSWVPASTGMPSGCDITSVLKVNDNIYVTTLGDGIFLTSGLIDIWCAANNGLPSLYTWTVAFRGDTLFLGTNIHGIWESVNGGNSWSVCTHAMDGNSVITIVFKGNHMFAGTSDGIYHLVYDGVAWNFAGKMLAGYTVNQLIFEGNYLFAGSNYGVDYSPDNGINWYASHDGLPNSYAVKTLAVHAGYLYAGTQGHGAYRRSLSEVLGIGEPEKDTPASLTITPNPAAESITLSISTSSLRITYLVTDPFGKLVLSGLINNSSSRIDISSLRNGLYILQVQEDDTILSGRFVKAQ
ncbi:MAG: T9SS type A sorting domain-containing protein [Bacteroidetes bacterium]|nr:T9SS type A sorting domain-containing protein [Bacteroidota bacterium]